MTSLVIKNLTFGKTDPQTHSCRKCQVYLSQQRIRPTFPNIILLQTLRDATNHFLHMVTLTTKCLKALTGCFCLDVMTKRQAIFTPLQGYVYPLRLHVEKSIVLVSEGSILSRTEPYIQENRCTTVCLMQKTYPCHVQLQGTKDDGNAKQKFKLETSKVHFILSP